MTTIHDDDGPTDGSTAWTTDDSADSGEVVRILDRDGRLLPDADPPPLTDEELLAIYENVEFARHFDDRALSIQRQGRLSTYASMRGQEGAQVGSAYALDETDWLLPTYRDHAAKLVHGMEPASLFTPFMGHRHGYEIPAELNVLPEYIPIATQIPQATGLAWGQQLQGNDDVVTLCYFGDGATSEGDFHEGLNFAGVFDVPAVFFCNNNQWAISTPYDRQTASRTIAQKAAAYGIDGARVDGMDPLAVYAVTSEAIDRARTPGDGHSRPTLIEAVQYRLAPHTTSDDPATYRDEARTARWERWDPLDRLETYLRETGRLDDELAATIAARNRETVEEAIATAESVDTDLESIVENVYATVPDRLQEQLDELLAVREKYGDELIDE